MTDAYNALEYHLHRITVWPHLSAVARNEIEVAMLAMYHAGLARGRAERVAEMPMEMVIVTTAR